MSAVRRRARLMVALGSIGALGAVVTPLFTGGATAQPVPPQADAAQLLIRSVDATQYPQLAVTVMTSVPGRAPEDFRVAVNGGEAGAGQARTLAEAGVPVGVVYVVDESSAMAGQGVAEAVRAALTQAAADKGANERLALVTYGVGARVVSGFTADGQAFARAAGSYTVSERPDAGLRDGMRLALDELRSSGTLQRNIVIVGAGGDDLSLTSFASVRGDLIDTDTVVMAVTLADAGDVGQIEELAALGRGRSVATPASGLVAAVAEAGARLRSQWLLTMTGPSGAELVDLTVSDGAAQGTARLTAGTFVAGRSVDPPAYSGRQLGPVGRLVDSTAPSFLRGRVGLVGGAVLALAAVSLFALALGSLITKDRKSLDQALGVYRDPARQLLDEDGDAEDEGRSKLFQRAIDVTSQFAQRRGLQSWVESALEQADLPLRAAEAIFVTAAFTVLLGLGTVILTRSLVLAFVVVLLLVVLPPGVLGFLAKRRRKQFVSQLPDALQLMSGSLKAGYSMMQGLEAVSQEIADPMGRELRRVVIEARLGRPIEEALDEAATRMASPDFAWAVMAIRIQREVGGNLAELLMTVADTMVARERLRRDVSSLTAEGRVSAYIIGVLPIGLAVVMGALNPSYISVLFSNRLGQVMLAGSVMLMLGGFVWMKKTIEIEV